MFPEESRGRQTKLVDLIRELSEKLLSNNEDQIKQYLNRLKIIYEDGFKHNYSDLFPVVTDIYREDNEYNVDYLSNNLVKLGTYLEDEYSKGNNEYSDIYKQFTKLCDHLNLQMGQLNYILSKETSNEALEKLKKDLETSNEQIIKSLVAMDESSKSLKEANEKADTIQTELIAMLSIFAAIVIAFSGGITLLGNSISSISNAKHYESVIMAVIICGMVMFNTIFLLMYFVSKLTQRNINVSCEAETCKNCKNEKCKWLDKIRKRYPYVFYYNCLSIVGILIDLGIWFMHMKGYIG